MGHRLEQGAYYDIALIDWQMPDMDGVETTRRIRALTGTETMIIIITAYDWGAVENSARQAGANAFITKPIFASTLYDTLLSVTGIERAVRPPGGTARRAGLAGHHVLLVEDNGLNREIAVELLHMADITVECAVNGREAVERFLSHGDSFDLILMDVQMPVMDGYQVLAVMKAKQWLDMLPVICISSETSGDSIRRVYRLGASDYFSRPFDAMTVFHRVESTIALHDKMTGDLQDAMKMLSSIFHRILKINLSTDTYTVIRGKDSIVSMPSSLSESLKMMADLKYIYEEDQEEYLKFCSMDNLRKELAKGRERISLNYRTLIKQEYRWVCMEVIRSAEYKPDDQIAMMYIRDINDEYLKQLDKIIRHAKMRLPQLQ